jgi:phosphocarrier protein FPr
MIGIVIVSHSAKLAEGVKELADQMVQGQVPLAAAGGIDDPNNPIGTDATKVHAAIESVYSTDGVLVLMDLGSALLSAETALVEFLSPEQQAHVYLVAAPLVEGTLAAVVQAAAGGDIQQVRREAMEALAAKVNQLEPSHAAKEAPAAAPVEPVTAAQTLPLTIQNRLGLHARPAANFVKTANRYQAEIRLSKGGKEANAKSINQVVTLGVRQGQAITITAAGPDAAEALAALKALADDNFGEIETPPSQPAGPAAITTVSTASSTDELIGIPASPGIAIGPVYHYRPTLPEITARRVTDVASEWSKLRQAIIAAQQDIRQLHIRAAQNVGASEAAIFEAHLLFLEDPLLIEPAKARIFETQLNAEAAWQQAVETVAKDYQGLDNEYLASRAADVLDVGQRVLRKMVAGEPPSLDLEQPSILVATDLTPSDTARLDPAKVLGLCTELGGATSHSAILARALGLPAIVGLNGAIVAIPENQIIALDGTSGKLWLHPDQHTLAELEARRAAWQQERRRAKATAHHPATTQDGVSIEVAANIGRPHEALEALNFGAEGVGLFRTEFLFMAQDRAPTEEEQLQAYRQAAQAMAQRPVIIRTLDVGGDKPLPYLEPDHEDNPFLGLRGIRFCLAHADLFKTQLRAILRASPGHRFKLMFPMIGALAELRAAKQILAAVQMELQQANLAYDETMEVGIMIEIPSAVAIAGQLAAEVDFFSIGSNDLAQYVMAADRGNSSVAALANALHPAVLRHIRQTVQAAHAAGIWVGLCGELAGNELATPLLIGLGLDELSLSPPHIPAVKTAIRQLTLAQARQIADKALLLESAEAVQYYLEHRE